MDRSASQLVGEAAPYLDETAPSHGGRNTRPLAIPVLVSSYCSTSRTASGAGAAVTGALAGLAAWFGLQQLLIDGSLVLAVVALVLAAVLAAAAVLLGIRLLRSGARIVAALRRWHDVAPEVPVRGADVVSGSAGVLRLVLAGVAILAGLSALALAATARLLSAQVGAGVAGLSLLAGGGLAILGWWRVRSLLRSSAPQSAQEAFAPAPYSQAGQAAGFAPAQPPPAPAPAQQWAPPPPAGAAPPTPAGAMPPTGVHPQPGATPPPSPAAQPWLPQPAGPAAETWHPGSEPDIGDTRLVADTTVSSQSRPLAVVLADGRRLNSGVITLIGRAPKARLDDGAVETVAVLHPTVSKTHAAVRVTDAAVYVTDRASTNGSTAVDHDGQRRRLVPWEETEIAVGGTVLLGSYRVAVVADDQMP